MRSDALAVAAVLGAASLTRLARLDLMEFKGDEAEACRLALHALWQSEPDVGRFFPTAGLVASVGIPNPPLFVYLLALPLAVARTPLAAAAFVALANVAAVWLCYVAGRRFFSRFVGLAAAGLFALSPWAIVYSRKIWAQDLLPLLTGLFLLALHAFLVERRPRALLWLLLLLGAATQIHFSAWILAGVLGAALILRREVVEWRWLALGSAGVALLYVPYLWHLLAVGDSSAGDDVPPPGPVGRFLDAGRFTLAITGGDGMSRLLGSQSALAWPLSVALGAVALAGLLSASGRRDRLPLAVWLLLPLLALTILPVTPYLHYFIVLLPLPFLGIACALERLRVELRLLALAACLGAFAIVDAGFFRTIVDEGGAGGGDYGVAYRYKADAAAAFVRENPGGRFRISTESDKEPRDLRLLVWTTLPRDAEPAGTARVGYLVAGSVHGIPDELRSPALGSYPSRRFGPLEVLTVPLADCRRAQPTDPRLCARF